MHKVAGGPTPTYVDDEDMGDDVWKSSTFTT